jgi:uncharacterized protein YcbX
MAAAISKGKTEISTCFGCKMSNIFVSELNIYPVKSTRGISLSEGLVTARGFALDRRWMLVDSYNRFLSQRQIPRLALVQVDVRENSLFIRAPDMPALAIPLQPGAGVPVRVSIWDDICEAQVVSDEANDWFSRFLDLPCHLVYMPDESQRPVNPQYSINDFQVSFVDGYPFLLISRASLDDLNRRLPQPLPMNRFRPNIVVEGCEPYAEDGWKQIRIGEVTFRVVKPCSRCKITTVNQQTGTSGKEPLKTLATYRLKDGKVYFGQNLIHENLGRIKLNQPVHIIQ